ncbi:c(7)-type cytochrome triheme protein [Geothermobacter ehrlichii]|uniref:C(7)-type cytochrome triheme protein n=1 Tax=Geothermobacter ehrlichii TaxID=213224 RepID=A0A5D3WHU1_9BACT|nr:c(7)-type cytochrome triheme domain-containing protein [Geothermobacter ehrlichii]TYO96637.1 c(7)-type cytochrome triheme protein [Geothermobacter ehrlichii]
MRLFITCLTCGLFLLLAGSCLADEADHGGDIHFKQPVTGVLFSHALHVEELGLECDSCHEGLFAFEAGVAEANGDFTMASLAEGNYCGACHDGDTAFSSETRCAVCHEGVKGYKRALGLVNDSGHGH